MKAKRKDIGYQYTGSSGKRHNLLKIRQLEEEHRKLVQFLV
jgi:hypothetical protein